jgi:hypothetical protein
VGSKRRFEGEILIDHMASPGLTADEIGTFGGPVVGKGEVYESAVYTCSHCQFTVVINPQRSRERAWCGKCDRYVCDECAELMRITLNCRDVKRQMDQILEELDRFGSTALILGGR